MEEKYLGPERREHVRLEKNIPVEFNLVNDVRSIELSKRRRATIQNISASGVRLEVEDLEETFIEGLYSGRVKLGLEIKLPGVERPVVALARVAWLTKAWQESSGAIKYILGLEFVDITTTDQDIIKNYVINLYLGGGLG